MEKGGARTFLEPAGPPQEKLTARDQQALNEQLQKLGGDGKKLGVAGRAGPRAADEVKRPASAPNRATASAPPGVQGRSAPREDKARSQQPKPN